MSSKYWMEIEIQRARLVSQLNIAFEELARLEIENKNNLAGMGYDV
jgi:hypothetical protein